MAGEIEEPFRLDFEVDSIHSGSISFGRFENESLCWERRSSFSHNRYLEEVEKCSKPGSVIEKKAYFEAHFRKKGFLGVNSPGCKNETGYDTGKDDDLLEKMDNDDEEFVRLNHDKTQYSSFERTEVYGTSFSEPNIELVSESNDSDCNTEHVKAVDGDGFEFGSTLSIDSKSGIKTNDILDGELTSQDEYNVPDTVIDKFPDVHKNGAKSDPSPKDLQGSSPKERAPSEAEYMKPRLIPQDRVEQRRYKSNNGSCKAAVTKVNKTVAVRSKVEKTSPAPKRSIMHETSKYKVGSKLKGGDELNRAGKQSTNRINVGPRPSTSEKISNREHRSANRFAGPRPSASEKISSSVHQNTNRVSLAVGAIKQNMRQDDSRFSFKSDERAQRRKEFEMKLEEKMHAREAKMHQIKTMTQEKKDAEIKQLRKSLNFKAIPMPSFYRRASLEPHGNYKDKGSNNNKPQKQGPKSSTPGSRAYGNSVLSTKAGLERPVSRSASTRITDQPQASVTSCHSTVTSESSATSRAGTSNRHPCPVVSKKKVLTKDAGSLWRNKVPEGNDMYKGKPFNRK